MDGVEESVYRSGGHTCCYLHVAFVLLVPKARGGIPLFTQLPRVSELVEKHLFQGAIGRFGASRAGLCSHKRAWIEFFNRLVL